MSAAPVNPTVNLDKIHVLIADHNQMSLDITGQALTAFGVRFVHKCDSGDDALKAVVAQPFDFIIADANLTGVNGFEFIKLLRRMQNQQTAFIPVVLTMGHARPSQVHLARDSGANFVVAKPITPKVLLERIFWVAREDRPFVETKSFIGPERRFKREGPPIGVSGRRKTDLHAELGEATMPNLSQDQISKMMKPMKVII
jgi:CheY-like chemotaxis protein